MEEKFNEMKSKYEAQDDILDSYDFIELDTRTLYQAIKSMLINTTSDCIKYECEMDPEMTTISALQTRDDLATFVKSDEHQGDVD